MKADTNHNMMAYLQIFVAKFNLNRLGMLLSLVLMFEVRML